MAKSNKKNKSIPVGVRFNMDLKEEYGKEMTYQAWLILLESKFMQKETVVLEKKPNYDDFKATSDFPTNYIQLMAFAKQGGYNQDEFKEHLYGLKNINHNQKLMIISKIV